VTEIASLFWLDFGGFLGPHLTLEGAEGHFKIEIAFMLFGKTRPRGTQEHPKSVQERPLSAQEHPECATNVSKRHPRASQELPKRACVCIYVYVYVHIRPYARICYVLCSVSSVCAEALQVY